MSQKIVLEDGRNVLISEIIIESRVSFYEKASKLKNDSVEQVKSDNIHIYPILQPVTEECVNPIYENMNSLPSLADITMDFLDGENNPLIMNFDWEDYWERKEFWGLK